MDTAFGKVYTANLSPYHGCFPTATGAMTKFSLHGDANMEDDNDDDIADGDQKQPAEDGGNQEGIAEQGNDDGIAAGERKQSARSDGDAEDDSRKQAQDQDQEPGQYEDLATVMARTGAVAKDGESANV